MPLLKEKLENLENIVIVPLTEKCDHNTLRLLPGLPLEKAVKNFLLSLKRYLKVRQADFIVYNREARLTSFSGSSHPDIIFEICRQSIDRHQSFYINSTQVSANNIMPSMDLSELKFAAIFVPISLPKGKLGCLYIGEPLIVKYFRPAHLQLLKAIAARFKKIFNNGWLHKATQTPLSPLSHSLQFLQKNVHSTHKIKDIRERFSSVMEVSNTIHSSQEISELVMSVLSSVCRVLRTESASLFTLDKKTDEFYFEVIAGKDNKELKGQQIPRGQGIVNLCAQEKKSIIVNNAAKDQRVYHKIENISNSQTRNLMAVPLLINQECIGVLEVINTVGRSNFQNEDLRLFESFSASVAIAIHRHLLLSNLRMTNKKLARKLRETTTLHAVAGVLTAAENSKQLFNGILTVIEKNLNIRCLFILLYNKNKESLVPIAARGISLEDIWKSIPAELAEYVHKTQKSLFIEDMNTNVYFQKFAKTKRKSRLGSCVLLVLKASKSQRGHGLLCVSEPTIAGFTKNDLRLLSTITSELSRGYLSFFLKKKLMEQKALQQEMEIASCLQRDILPEDTLEHNYLTIKSHATMARTIGGDLYYYCAKNADAPVNILIGDVSGKSLSAAFFMAMASSILKTILQSETVPAQVLAKANQILYQESKRSMFVTLFLAYYDPQNNILEYASAGHNQMLLLRKDGSYELLSGKGKPLGVQPSDQQEYITKRSRVSPGDMLVLYTDGITEAINSQKKEFGLARLIRIVQAHKNENLHELINIVHKSIADHSGEKNIYDDLTLLICRFKSPVKNSQEYNFSMPATKTAALEVIRKTEKILLENSISNDTKNDILLIIEEAAANIVNYAYKDMESKNSEFHYSLILEPQNRLKIVFQDQGKKFDFQGVESPDIKRILEGKIIGGFGIHLIKSLADKVNYSREKGTNILNIEKKINL